MNLMTIFLVFEMVRSAPVAFLGSEFDDFLFAPVAEGRNGMLLSVVSALARLGVDPWQEAAKLAHLPMEAAIQRLAALIVTLPSETATPLDPRKIAVRLVALLPRHPRSDGRREKTSLKIETKINTQTVIKIIFISLVFAVVALATQSLIASLT